MPSLKIPPQLTVATPSIPLYRSPETQLHSGHEPALVPLNLSPLFGLRRREFRMLLRQLIQFFFHRLAHDVRYRAIQDDRRLFEPGFQTRIGQFHVQRMSFFFLCHSEPTSHGLAVGQDFNPAG